MDLSPVLYVLSKAVSYTEFVMEFCIYDDVLDTIWITDKKFTF